jgi:hypothetical protein
MPYSIIKGGGTCGASEWAVLADSGRTMGCHASKSGAQDQLAALYANGADEDTSASTSDTTPHAPRGRMMVSRHVTSTPTTTREFPVRAARDRHSPHHG